MAGEIDAHLGQRLRRRRWMLGLTQSQLGERVGIKFQQVQKYETGQNRISASRLWDLANAVDVPVSYFYDGLGDGGADDLDAEIGRAEAMAAGEEPIAPSTDNALDLKGDLLNDREAIDLVRSYYLVPETPRRRLFELVKAMGDAAADDEADASDKDDLQLRAG